MSEDSRSLWVGEELRHDEGHRVGGDSEGRSYDPENGCQFSSQLSLDRHTSLDCLAAVQASPWIDAGFLQTRRRWRIACELMEAWTMLDNGHLFVL